ncbi:MAG: hypothetical protein GWP04_05045 [Gammaproteobacteria bacterium]|nr:hypothetical protein [Gammaproteobacteria bacterium]
MSTLGGPSTGAVVVVVDGGVVVDVVDGGAVVVDERLDGVTVDDGGGVSTV